MNRVYLIDKHISHFQNKIWDYYKKYKRDLPWRHTKNPYYIFVSEVMFQQTQVERVIVKYHTFLKEFPDFSSLAKAPLSLVLQLWQGLGYNRRALYLHRSAILISQHYHNVMPQDPKMLDNLPGIGEATASSIIVFSYNIPLVFIETNIRRVFIDYFFDRRRDDNKKGLVRIHDKDILPLVEKTLDRENPREWYYGLMDYGALLGRTIDNPNRRSAHYAKQSKFEGSRRQIRGRIVRLLLRKKRFLRKTLREELNLTSTVDIQNILYQLEKEGFVRRKGAYLYIK